MTSQRNLFSAGVKLSSFLSFFGAPDKSQTKTQKQTDAFMCVFRSSYQYDGGEKRPNKNDKRTIRTVEDGRLCNIEHDQIICNIKYEKI